MRTPIESGRRLAALATAVLLGGVLAGSAAAQETPTDPRWHGWLGCWEPSEAPLPDPAAESGAPMLCVLPAPGGPGVEVVTLVAGEVEDRQTIEATGGRRATAADGCTGWESAEWSADGHRLFRRAEESCPGGVARREHGLSTLLPSGEWVDVQGAATGERMGVRVVRYREVLDRDRWPAAAVTALEGRTRDVAAARTAAAVRLRTEDVAEAALRLETPVVEAWLIERRQGFATELDAERLVQLAEAGVPEPVIDLMVALSYPGRFAVDQLTGDAERRPDEDGGRRPIPGRVYPRGPFGYGGYGWYPGYGRYPGGIVIVDRPGDGDGGSGGRAVKGRGYRRGGDGGGASGVDRSTGRSPGSGSAGASGSSGGSRSGGTRTAKPRSGGPG